MTVISKGTKIHSSLLDKFLLWWLPEDISAFILQVLRSLKVLFWAIFLLIFIYHFFEVMLCLRFRAFFLANFFWSGWRLASGWSFQQFQQCLRSAKTYLCLPYTWWCFLVDTYKQTKFLIWRCNALKSAWGYLWNLACSYFFQWTPFQPLPRPLNTLKPS